VPLEAATDQAIAACGGDALLRRRRPQEQPPSTVRMPFARSDTFVNRWLNIVTTRHLLIIEEQIGSIQPIFLFAQMKPKHSEREARRTRHLSAWIKVGGRAHCECQVLDISKHGAKVMVDSVVPDRFELAFFEGGQHRVCEVVWRRVKMIGVKFLF
jgi:hypothetical protein